MPLMRKPVSGKRKARSAERSLTFKKRKTLPSRTLGLGRVTALTSNDFGFPDRLSTKLCYGDAVNITMTSGALSFYTFRMNGLYDPDYTGAGHQPQWFDQLAAVYRNYRVKGAKIFVDFISNYADVAGATYGPYLVGITCSNQTSLNASTAASLTEDANGVSAILSKSTGGKPYCKLTNTFSPSRDLGLDPMEGDVSALTSTVPNAQFFAHVFAMDLFNTNTQSMKIRVKIEYQCEFFNRIEGVLS